MPTSTSTATATTCFQFDKFLPLYIFPRLAFMIIIFFFFVLLAAHGVRQLFEQMKLLIRYVFNFDKDSQTISQQQQQQQLRHFCVCLRKCRRENLSWLLCKEIKCVLSEINFIAALSEREKREGGEWKGSTAEDYRARVRSGIRIDFFIAILFDCAHTKLRIRNVETSTGTSR